MALVILIIIANRVGTWTFGDKPYGKPEFEK